MSSSSSRPTLLAASAFLIGSHRCCVSRACRSGRAVTTLNNAKLEQATAKQLDEVKAAGEQQNRFSSQNGTIHVPVPIKRPTRAYKATQVKALSLINIKVSGTQQQ